MGKKDKSKKAKKLMKKAKKMMKKAKKMMKKANKKEKGSNTKVDRRDAPRRSVSNGPRKTPISSFSRSSMIVPVGSMSIEPHALALLQSE